MTVDSTVRNLQYRAVVEHVEKLGHSLNDFPKLRNNRCKTTCKNCGLFVEIRKHTIKLPGGMVNLQMVAEGPLMVHQCRKDAA